jgi:hypothetical protein
VEINPGAVQTGYSFRLDAPVLAGKQYHDFAPGPGQGGYVLPDKLQGCGNIGSRFQGIHQVKTADDGLHVPNTLHPAGYFPPGSIRHGNQVKGIADTQKFLEKGPGKVVPQFKERAAQRGRRIQEQDQIHSPLFLAGGPGKNSQKQRQDKNQFFHIHPIIPEPKCIAKTPPEKPLSPR